MRGTELVATPGLPEAPDLASALGKLRETLGPETLDADGLIEVMGGGIAPEHLALLREAAETHHRVDIEYFSASSEAVTRGATKTRNGMRTAANRAYAAAIRARRSGSSIDVRRKRYAP